MAAVGVCGLDCDPSRVTAVIDNIDATRTLIEQIGFFALQVPTQRQFGFTYTLGNTSRFHDTEKLANPGAKLFQMPGIDIPLVKDCSAWLICKLISEPHNQRVYDLFIGEVVGTWAVSRIFEGGHCRFERAPASMRSICYTAGEKFYGIGESISLTKQSTE